MISMSEPRSSEGRTRQKDIEVHHQEPRHKFEYPLLLVIGTDSEWYIKIRDGRAIAVAVYDFSGKELETHRPHPCAPIPGSIAQAIEQYDGQYGDFEEILNPVQERPEDDQLVAWLERMTPTEGI